MKPLSSPETIYRHFKLRNFTLPVFSRPETHNVCSQKSWHSFAGRSLVRPGLVACTALQTPSLTVRDVTRMQQSDWRATIVALTAKIVDQFPSACANHLGTRPSLASQTLSEPVSTPLWSGKSLACGTKVKWAVTMNPLCLA